MAAPAVRLRAMTETDLAACALVRKAAGEDLARSQGRAQATAGPPQRPLLQRHVLRTDPGGSWVAENNEILVGYAQAYVRGDIWYLSQLFVLPEAQSLGVGRGVLERAISYGQDAGAKVFAVAASTSLAANALYLRHGMYPSALCYRLAGPVAPLLSLDAAPEDNERFEGYAGHEDEFAGLDRAVWGAERRREHAVFEEGGFADEETVFGLSAAGNLLGYAYVMDDGWIGPIAAREPALQLPLLRIAADWLQQRGVEQGQCYCLSLNRTLIEAFMNAGWRINGWNFLLTSAPFGQLDRYLPSGGMIL